MGKKFENDKIYIKKSEEFKSESEKIIEYLNVENKENITLIDKLTKNNFKLTNRITESEQIFKDLKHENKKLNSD